MVEAKDSGGRKVGQGQRKENEQAKTQAERRAEERCRVQETVLVNEKRVRQEGKEEPGWFHICSQGLEGVDLFPDDNAFIVGGE